MEERDSLVAEQSTPIWNAEFALPEDPVLRDLAIKKFNGQNGVVYVPIQTTDVMPDAVKAPENRPKQDDFLAKLLRSLSEDNPSQQNRGTRRGWSD